jgi:hypothetical protein
MDDDDSRLTGWTACPFDARWKRKRGQIDLAPLAMTGQDGNRADQNTAQQKPDVASQWNVLFRNTGNYPDEAA